MLTKALLQYCFKVLLDPWLIFPYLRNTPDSPMGLLVFESAISLVQIWATQIRPALPWQVTHPLPPRPNPSPGPLSPCFKMPVVASIYSLHLGCHTGSIRPVHIHVPVSPFPELLQMSFMACSWQPGAKSRDLCWLRRKIGLCCQLPFWSLSKVYVMEKEIQNNILFTDSSQFMTSLIWRDWNVLHVAQVFKHVNIYCI